MVLTMAEYIERETLLALMRPDDPNDEKAAITIATAKKLIRRLAYRVPAADVAPVRHGRWIYVDTDKEEFFVCNRCKKKEYWESNYCPNCGSKMDRGENHA